MADEANTRDELTKELKELRQRIAELEESETKRKKVEEALNKLTHDLRKRVKELNGLYDISNLVEKQDITLDEIIQGTVYLIPPAWQYPEITCARGILDGKEYRTKNFKEGIWKQTADIILHGEKKGTLEVCYLEERPQLDEGPFLKEERALLKAIAERMGKIIERKRAEEEEFNDLARFPGENPDPVLRISNEGIIIYRNKASFPLLNYWQYQEDRPIPEQWHKIIMETLDTGHSQQAEIECDDRVLSLMFVPVMDSNYVNVYGLDITYLKQAEEDLQTSEKRYHSLFESMLNSLAYCKILVDKDNQPIDYVHLEVNDAWEMSFGIKKEDIVGKKITEVIPGIKEFKPDLINIYGKVALTGEATKFDLYFEPLEKWFTISVYSPQKTYFVAIFEDITDRKKREEEREQLMVELEAKNREMESFVYTVSHDLKAPLISLEGFSSALKKKFHERLGKRGMHYVERIQANVVHMETLIMDLLELSRIGRVVEQIEDIDVAALVREIQKELAVELDRVGAGIVVQKPLPVIQASRVRIRQVFANLINNALKFRSQERPLSIEVGCREERRFYRFHVTDNGIGIDPKYHKQIFTPFQKLNAEAEGVGIGLNLVKKIVEHHGGRIWVESPSASLRIGEEGKGATFYFTLPRGKS